MRKRGFIKKIKMELAKLAVGFILVILSGLCSALHFTLY